ncbi:hypothetical protein [Arthrobacter antioxidans]|uniref:hypothetical protein n=1 Tax=Arthrobacter antioxidans TaxID=2895818 RepID=UPI001FFFB9BF|nr:hypothetical protein [Arthrobacter antioxidans]
MNSRSSGGVPGGSVVAAGLILAAALFVRPNVLSVNYAIVGTALCAAAAVIAALADLKSRRRVPGRYALLVIVLGLAYLWLAINASIFSVDTITVIAQGFVTTVLTTALVGVVLADPRRRRLVARCFIGLVLAVCGSYAVTLASWLVAGFGALDLLSFEISRNGGTATVYFPFTVTFGVQPVGAIMIPRLTGIGREPGWMSFYAGMALLIWRRVGTPRPAGQALLILGLLGPLSTAGFGAFAVVLAIVLFAKKPRTKDVFVHYIVFIIKCGVLAGAVYCAVFAPILGFAAKADFNEVSLNERSSAIRNGVEAMTSSPLGGAGEGAQTSITLIAAIAPFGIPYFLLILAALLLPRIGHPAKHRTTGPIALVLITLLLSQPPGDSTFVFILAGLTYVIALPDMEGADEFSRPRTVPLRGHAQVRRREPGRTRVGGTDPFE